MKLSTGKVAFPIEFDTGDKDCIYFNPNDPDLGVRLVTAREKIQKRMENMKIEEIELSNSGEALGFEGIEKINGLTDEEMSELIAKTNEIAKTINETRNIICSELDIAFGSEVSAVVFKHTSPFAIVNGNYFIMNFIEAITPEIQEYVKKANADVEKRMQKHIAKYKK